jgi:hypothetical protein
VAAPFVMLGASLLLSAGVAVRSPLAPEKPGRAAGQEAGRPGLRRTSDL